MMNKDKKDNNNKLVDEGFRKAVEKFMGCEFDVDCVSSYMEHLGMVNCIYEKYYMRYDKYENKLNVWDEEY